MKLYEKLRATADRGTRVPSVDTILKRPRSARPPKARKPLLVQSLVGAVLVFAFALSLVMRRFDPGELDTASPGSSDAVGYSTSASEMATVQLSDGSVVRLAPSTKLRF